MFKAAAARGADNAVDLFAVDDHDEARDAGNLVASDQIATLVEVDLANRETLPSETVDGRLHRLTGTAP